MKTPISMRRTLVYGVLSASLIVAAGCNSSDDDASPDDGMTPSTGDMDGADGADGMDGEDGEDGMDGADGEDGPDGMDGEDGMDGMDGEDTDAVQETVNDDGTSTFIVPLSADQEVPPVDADDATGEGNFTIDTASGVVTGSVVVSGLTGEAATAHIHRGFAGTNGPILITLVGNDDGTEWTAPEGDEGTLDPAGLEGLANGELYLNVHTAENEGGEIRGQIVPDGILVEFTELSGDNEVPPVETEARGVGASTLNTENGAISGTVRTEGVEARAAHIHAGEEGENGGVLITMTQDAEDAAVWSTPADATLSAEEIEAYDDGLYFNVHSELNSDGEIRGQL